MTRKLRSGQYTLVAQSHLAQTRFNSTNFCKQFQITLKSMRSQFRGQSKSLNFLLNSRPENRIVYESL